MCSTVTGIGEIVPHLADCSSPHPSYWLIGGLWKNLIRRWSFSPHILILIGCSTLQWVRSHNHNWGTNFLILNLGNSYENWQRRIILPSFVCPLSCLWIMKKKNCSYNKFWNQVLQLGHTSQVKGTVLHKTGPTIDRGHNSWIHKPP